MKSPAYGGRERERQRDKLGKALSVAGERSRVDGWAHDRCKRKVQINREWYNAQRDAYKVQRIAQKGRPPRHRKLAFFKNEEMIVGNPGHIIW